MQDNDNEVRDADRESVEELLRSVRAVAAPAAMRDEVLKAVDDEVCGRPARWDRWIAASAAALLVVATISHQVVQRSEQQRLARIYGPRPTPQSVVHVAQSIRTVSDDQAAEWFERELAMVSRRGRPPTGQLTCDWKKVLDDFTHIQTHNHQREALDVEEDDEMGRNQHRDADRHPADHSYRPQLERGNSA